MMIEGTVTLAASGITVADYADVEFGHAFVRYPDHLPPWHDDEPSVACLVCLRSYSEDRFVYALHTTPLHDAAVAPDAGPHFRLSQFEAARPSGHWRDDLVVRTCRYLLWQAKSSKRAAMRAHPQVAAATVWWNTVEHRFVLVAHQTLLDQPDFVPWLAARCSMVEGSYAVFAEEEHAGRLIKEADAVS